MALLTLLAVTTFGIIRLRSLFAVVIMAGVYSFLMASLLIALDAVDVAMTEASVGAGVSTVILLATLHLTKTREIASSKHSLAALVLVFVVAGALVFGTLSLPPFGVADSVIHQHVAPYYLANTIKDTGVPNAVTSVLADYRGYDTLGETAVIFTAGIGVMLLLSRRRRQGEEHKNNREPQ
jgi:multicomponent Na+:H+ antiporter subunit B